MADLVAQGPKPDHRWRRTIPPGPQEVGRTTRMFAVPWDRQISRSHFVLEVDGERLKVKKKEEAGNPIFFGGKQLDKFIISSGDHFVIGQTTFLFTNERAAATLDMPEPNAVQAFSHQDIRKVAFSDSDRRLRVLNDLPEIIASSTNESDLFVRVCSVLLAGVRSANTVAVVKIAKSGGIEVLHWDRRIFAGEDFRPSERLIRRAIKDEETVLHFWDVMANALSKLTVQNENQWAFVSPLGGQACRNWAIYMLGNEKDRPDVGTSRVSNEMQSDIKFTELVGGMVANLRDVQVLERNQSALRSFFSPVVMEAFAGQSLEEALTPRKCEISVLFCDLRGFSRKSEEFADNLLELLDRVSQALGITTKNVLREGGVIGDFHGDAVMGFWGWPLDQEDSVVRACRAALEIEKEFRALAEQKSNLSDFRIGIGIASGESVAGRIGTSDQVKVTAFGPTVNLASRLEGLTKQWKIPVLVDENSMRKINADPQSDLCAIRLAKVRPVGMSRAVEIGQLVSTESAQSFDFVFYEHALTMFNAGNWDGARQKLDKISVVTGPVSFLLEYMDRHQRPSEGFDGVIELDRK